MLRVVAAVLFASAAAACAGDSSSGRNASASRVAGSRSSDGDSAGGNVDLGASGYAPGPLTAVGSVSGTITIDGAAPAGTARITADQKTCGTSAPRAVETGAKGGLSNAVVWVADAKTGKSLPIDKRFELSSEKCDLDPRVQTAVADPP